MINMQAMNNYIILKMMPPRERVVGKHGVIVPEMKLNNVSTGIVESLGPTVRIKELQKGMTVLFPPYGTGHRNTVDGIEYVSLLDWEIIAYFES